MTCLNYIQTLLYILYMVNINNLSKQEKQDLLSQLLNDPDTLEISEAEFQDRIMRVIKRLYDAVEGYLKEIDKLHSDERKNIWHIVEQTWKASGRAEVCARIKTILNEIIEEPLLTEEGYEVLQTIKKKKNQIVNNELSNYFRGRRQDYQKLFRFEGKCADALENEWSYAFLLGLNCKDKISEERLKKIRDNEKNIEQELLYGSYDKNRIIKDVLYDTYNNDKKYLEQIMSILPKEDNPHYDEIMNFLNTYNKDEN